MYVLFSLVAALFVNVLNAGVVRVEKNVLCQSIPEKTLVHILGPAYNTRYMSINEPATKDNANCSGQNIKKNDSCLDPESKRNSNIPAFYVEEDFVQDLGGDEPAWKLDHVAVPNIDQLRTKRNIPMASPRQWECKSKIVWIDLGADYFPRYLRTIECVKKACWYGYYVCKPQSFTVKILKRRRGVCVEAAAGHTIGDEGLHVDLRELWIWEEHAVNFCCGCSKNL